MAKQLIVMKSGFVIETEDTIVYSKDYVTIERNVEGIVKPSMVVYSDSVLMIDYEPNYNKYKLKSILIDTNNSN